MRVLNNKLFVFGLYVMLRWQLFTPECQSVDCWQWKFQCA